LHFWSAVLRSIIVTSCLAFAFQFSLAPAF